MKKTPLCTTLIATLVLFLGTTLSAQDADWPQWRGPDRDGCSKETGLLKSWPREGPKELWTISGLGEGYATISVKDGRIYTMGTHDGGEAVFALDYDTGRQVWVEKSSNRVFNESRGNGPRATPTVDGDHLYTEDALGIVSCWEAKTGKRVWTFDLTRDGGGRIPTWGYSEHPLIVGKGVIVTPGGGKGTICALDKKTGKLIWQSRQARHAVAYSSPIFVTAGGKRQIINMTGTGSERRAGTMIGVDAENGNLLWEFSPGVAQLACCTPIYHDGIVVATSGYNQGTAAADISGGKPRQLWHIEQRGSHHGGMVLVKDHLYGFIDALTCIDLKTGEVAWQDRSVGKGSLVYADGHLYCLSEGHTAGLVEATPEKYNETGRFRLSPNAKRPSWAHPVVAGGRLFIRDQDVLHCYDVKAR